MDRSARTRLVHVEHVMGTAVSFDLRGAGDLRTAVEEAVSWFHEVDRRFSPYRPDSEVRRFAAIPVAERSADLAGIVAACDDLEALTGGVFRADRGDGWDPTGYVKGWSVDRAAAILDARGCTDWSINAGGDVRVRRPRSAGPWRIGVRHPDDAEALAAVLPGWDLAVATSGAYERGDHVVDPRTGLPPRGALSATVCGPELGVADALATAAFVLGADGPALVAAVDGYECWSALPGGRVLATAGLPRLVDGVPITVGPTRAPFGAAA